VAIDLEPELRAKVTEIGQKIAGYGVKPIEPDSLHITLKFLGELGELQVKDAISQLKKVDFSTFEIKIAGLGAFPSSNYIRVIWLGIESKELMELAKLVDEKLAGFRKDERGFSAHLTIARVSTAVPGLAEKITSLKGIEIGRQTVKDFRLKKSTLTPKGPIYSDIEVFESC
jgi:2'-5' RNA ligase